MRAALLCHLAAAYALAQPVIAPTDSPTGPPRGQDINGYNITNSFEVGYRFRDVSGNVGKYRSDVNFGNGVRLLGSRLAVNSKEGHGGYFDELLLNTQGLGNDPYEFASLRVQKNRLYKYDLLWRQNDYYNPVLPIANGQHFLDTTRRLQDHVLTLLPQSFFKVHLGYSRMSHSGPGLSTINLFDIRGDEFPLSTDIRRSQNEYRLGFDVALAGFKLTVMRGWEYFKDDTRQTASQLAGNNPTDLTTLDSLRRDQPYHGDTDTWRLNLLYEPSRLIALNGRYAWAGGQRDFIFDEMVTGTDRFGAARSRQTLVFGNARRPVSSGALTTSFYPAEALTVVNHTSFHDTQMEGDATYRELLNAGLGFSEVDFSFLGIRTIATTTDVNFRTTGILTLYGGHHYSQRRIRSIEQVVFADTPERVESEYDNTLNAGRAGVRLRGWRRLTINLDGELGRADRPVYPTSERNYHALGARVQYRTNTFTASATARTNYNVNSVSLFSHSSKSRNYSADVSWTPVTWAGLDASYSKLHLHTLSGVAYFYTGTLTNGTSEYVSNIHAGTLTARISPHSRIDLFAGYTRVQDTGGTGAVGLIPGLFQQYPLTYHTPMARVSVRLHQKVRWNAGYQRYMYAEDIAPVQNYGAHTGFVSLSWSF